MGSDSRRGFLKKLAAAAAGALALEVPDPERLLWVPGQKTIIDLGAAKPLERPTNEDVFHFSELFDPSKWSPDEYRAARNQIRERPIYMPDRFVLATADGRSASFDSDFNLTVLNGRHATDREKAEHAARRGRRVSLNEFERAFHRRER